MSEARLRSGVRDYFTHTPEQLFIFVNVFARAINQLAFSSGNKWQSRMFEPRGHSEEKLDASTNSLGRSCCHRSRWRKLFSAPSRSLAITPKQTDISGGNYEEALAF
jgi:hypothetical protein